MGLGQNGMGEQWDGGKMGQGQNGMEKDEDGDTMGLGHNGTGAQWADPNHQATAYVPTPTALGISYVKYFWNLQAIRFMCAMLTFNPS